MAKSKHRTGKATQKQRLAAAGWVTTSEAIAAIVRQTLAGEEVSRHVLLGPVCWQPGEGKRSWYFMIGGGDRDGFRVDQIVCADEAHAVEVRNKLQFAFVGKRPIVIHDLDDELEMACVAEGIWPGKKTATIRFGIEAERAGRAAK